MTAIQRRSENTPTHLQCCGTNLNGKVAILDSGYSISTNAPQCACGPFRVALSAFLCASLLFPGGAFAAAGPVPLTQTTKSATSSSKASSKARAKKKPAPPRPPITTPGAEGQLEKLSHALHDQPTPEAYEQLSQFADKQANTALGARAALALGYYDSTRSHFPEARKWLLRAAADPVIGDYSLYLQGVNDRAAGASDVALAELKSYRQKYPNSAISDSAVEELARAALAADQPQEAASALNSYDKAATKSSLLLLRAQAREKAAILKGEKPVSAATDYLDLIYHFPLSDEAKASIDHIPFLQLQLGEQFPGTPVDAEIARAETFYDARRWKDLRPAYEALLPKLSGAARERATLRIAQVGVQLGGSPDALASLKLTDPELDAERIYTLSQIKRAVNVENDMFANIEKLVSLYPQSPWAEQALMAAGNYEWANLDRGQASTYYQRLITQFPAGRDVPVAQWRIVWTAYMARQSDAVTRLEQYLRQYPTSSYTVDALYWIGRAYERTGNLSLARTFYLEAEQRFPQTYFGEHAVQRLDQIGSSPATPADILSVISPAPPLTGLAGPLPAAAIDRWNRAQALESIAFDSSAELELRSAYADTHASQLLLAIAEAAVKAGHYPAGIVATRQVVPQLEARRLDEVPDDAWRTAYPLPYRDWVEREAQRNHLDPMLIAGLVRQESAFASDAVSRSDAVGLMQLLPTTGAQQAEEAAPGILPRTTFRSGVQYSARKPVSFRSGRGLWHPRGGVGCL